jgi:arylsulfatase A-like enzyme/tetratricopeptide (TPR) repeat protein
LKKLAFAAAAIVLVLVLTGLHFARRASIAAGDSLAGAAAGANVLIVTVDTLRADHLVPYGYTRIETPTITRLAREGVRFSAAFSPVPLTLPSHCSIFTGQLPFTHGVRDNSGFYLDGTHQTLATVLKSAGYRSGGFVSAFTLDRRWGIAQGFDHYFDNFTVTANDLAAMARIQRPAAETWAQARPWLDQHASERFFLWLHLFDPHTPYEPPEPFRTRYADRLYDGEIAYVDSVLAEVLAYLESRSLLEKTLIVFLSDHGEGLGDHGEDEHGLLTYDSTLRVPWILRLPGRLLAGTVVTRPVSLVDVFPTTLDLLGLAVPKEIDGTSRTRLMRDDNAPAADVLYAETYYPRFHFGWSELVGVRNERFKLIRGPKPRLYDYQRDPAESADLASRQPDTTARLDQILTRMTAGRSKQAPQATTPEPETARRLQSLGYVTGITTSTAGRDGLADPEDKVGVYRTLMHAEQLLAEGSGPKGLQALETVLQQEPDLEAAHRTLRGYWISRRRFPEAEHWLRAKLQARPSDPQLLVDLGAVRQAAGRPVQALAALKAALDRRPEDVEALTLSGEILRAGGQYDAALACFAQAERGASDPSAVKMQTAETLVVAQRLADAESVLKDALRLNAHTEGAHYLLAQIAEQRRDGTGAEREYREEIRLYPWDYKARFNLALLLDQRDEHKEQVALLESIPNVAPEFSDVYFYLAKALLDTGDPGRFEEAIAAAHKGLHLAPDSPSAPLGHYVLADVYRLQGRRTDAEREIEAGRKLEQKVAGPRR